MVRGRLVAAVGAWLLVACFSDSGDGQAEGGPCPEGSATCPCRADGSCDEGLMCDPILARCRLPDDATTTATTTATTAATTTMTTTMGSGTSGPGTSTTGPTGGTGPGTGPGSSTGAPPTEVVLFLTQPRDGDLTSLPGVDTRDKVDTFCADQKTALHGALPCQNLAAVITISASDSVQFLPIPSNLDVRGPTGIDIQDSWGQLLEGDALLMSLNDAGAGTVGSTTFWWSGSQSDGSPASSQNCGPDATTRWSDATLFGRVGHADRVDNTWIDDSDQGCALPRSLLCACW